MNDKDMFFFRNCLIGMAIPGLSSDDVIDSSVRGALCVTHALASSEGKQEAFISFLKEYLSSCDELNSPALIAVRSLPIGLYHKDLQSVIEWSRDSALLSDEDPVTSVSSAAVALMGFLAKALVPIGLWGHELCTPLAGLSFPPGLLREDQHDDVFVSAIMDACKAAGSDKGVYSGSSAPHEAVAGALFGCMSDPNNFEVAIGLASASSGKVAASIAGGLMAIKLGGVPSSLVPPVFVSELFGDAAMALSG
jgi:hypothetical protein